jgi:hypothetical protein
VSARTATVAAIIPITRGGLGASPLIQISP